MCLAAVFYFATYEETNAGDFIAFYRPVSDVVMHSNKMNDP